MAILLRFLIIAFVIYWLFFRPRRFRRSREPKNSNFNPSKSPYEVLKVSPNADLSQIKKAYHQALSKHHPDKVDHLGEDLQKLAKEKTEEIMWAYETLKKQKSF